MTVAIIVHCTECGEGYRYQSGAFPLRCPRCGEETLWKGATIIDDPKVPYELYEMDRRLLRSLRIATDEPPDDAVTS